MLKELTLQQFCTEYLNIWIDAMCNENSELLCSWHDSSKWTAYHMKEVLYPLAENLGCNGNVYVESVQQEYYRVDFTIYNYFEQSVWTLDYAIEHENVGFELQKNGSIKHKGWYDEFAKLLPLKCAKARVIIGYDSFTELFYEKIKKCRNLLNDERVQPSLADSPILLIIFPRTNYINKGEFNNGLIHLVRFYKEENGWDIDCDFENEVCNAEMLNNLRKVYAKIGAATK